MDKAFEPIHIGDPLAGESMVAELIPLEQNPTRVALTPNLLLPFRLGNETKLLYHNFDPLKWNQWYPIFNFYHCDYVGSRTNTLDLIDFVESQSEVSEFFDKDQLTDGLARRACEIAGFERVAISAKPLVRRDYWLKYSKSTNRWTLYCYIFYLPMSLTPTSIVLTSDNPLLALIPLEAKSHNGLAIVENVVELLENTRHLAAIASHAISI